MLTTDAIVGGVHFFPDDPPDAVARKALRVNLSDLAAKGAKPAGFLLALALPKAIGDAWLEGFRARARRGREAYSAARCSAATRCARPGPLTVSITAFGYAAARHHGPRRRRPGRRPGHGHRHDRRRGAWA